MFGVVPLRANAFELIGMMGTLNLSGLLQRDSDTSTKRYFFVSCHDIRFLPRRIHRLTTTRPPAY